MSWLVIAAIFWEKKGRTAAGAACLAGAVLLKAFALTLLCYYVWRGKWKMVGVTLVAILLLRRIWCLPSAVFGWHGNLHYISEWTHEVAAPALGLRIVAHAFRALRSAPEYGAPTKSGFGFRDATPNRRPPNSAHGPGTRLRGAGGTNLAHRERRANARSEPLGENLFWER